MAVLFKKVQANFRTLDEARLAFTQLQDAIAEAMAKVQASAAPVPSVLPGGAAITIGNGPDTLQKLSPSRFVSLVADDGAPVLVPGYR